MKLSQVIEELVEEKDLDRGALSAIVCEGMLAAYKKKYPELELSTAYNKANDLIDVLIAKTVVQNVQDEDIEISLRKARAVDPNAALGDILQVPFDGAIGRIEILRAKQVIAQRIRAIESSIVFNEFKPKEGMLLHGVVHKCEHGGVTVKIQDTFAFLPKSLMIPGDRCVAGYPIRAVLKEVLPEPRNENQLILDRSSVEFLRQLFELEIPEVFERIVELRTIVRAAGYKSKVVVSSSDKNIDPVGTCVGVGGARIKPILRELGVEKIDIISATSNTEQFVRDALKPAAINRVEVDGGVARVWLDEDQRSVAIGKMGKNIALASQLTGLQIELVKSSGGDAATFDDVFKERLQAHLDAQDDQLEKSETDDAMTQEERE